MFDHTWPRWGSASVRAPDRETPGSAIVTVFGADSSSHHDIDVDGSVGVEKTEATMARLSPSEQTESSTSTREPLTNLAVLAGVVTADPISREVNGALAWQFDVATEVDVHGAVRRLPVPVNWFDPATSEIEVVRAGVEVVVVGTVRRRFFRSGGQTASRTEVVPDRVVPTRRRATVRSLLAAVAARVS